MNEKIALSVLSALTDPIIIFEKTSKIIYVNEAFTRQTGYTLKDLFGLPPFFLQSLNQNPLELNDIEYSLKQKNNIKLQIQILHKNGEFILSELELTSIRFEPNESLYCLGILRNFNRYLHFISENDLPNRYLAMDRMQQAIIQARNKELLMGFFLIDIDRLRYIVNTYGYDQGNKVLKEISTRLKIELQESDTIAYMGEDAFAVIVVCKNDVSILIKFAERILKVLTQPYYILEQVHHLSFSIGITSFPKDGLNSQTLLKNAEIALQRAKQIGDNHFEFYTDEMNIRIMSMLQIENQLRMGIQTNQFFLEYQPIYSLKENRINSVEALIRWNHPTKGLILPMQFIKFAEETGQIYKMSYWVLENSVKILKEWSLIGFDDLHISINISAFLFKDINLIKKISDCLNNEKIDPKKLEIEITESSIIEQDAHVQEVMLQAKKLGLTISIDDFGTGYSNIHYLTQFPIDKIKIDRFFITYLDDEKSHEYQIIKAIIAMGKALNLKILVEGVETKNQLEILRKLNCDQVQGFYISKPLNFKECCSFLKSNPTF